MPITLTAGLALFLLPIFLYHISRWWVCSTASRRYSARFDADLFLWVLVERDHVFPIWRIAHPKKVARRMLCQADRVQYFRA